MPIVLFTSRERINDTIYRENDISLSPFSVYTEFDYESDISVVPFDLDQLLQRHNTIGVFMDDREILGEISIEAFATYSDFDYENEISIEAFSLHDGRIVYALYTDNFDHMLIYGAPEIHKIITTIRNIKDSQEISNTLLHGALKDVINSLIIQGAFDIDSIPYVQSLQSIVNDLPALTSGWQDVRNHIYHNDPIDGKRILTNALMLESSFELINTFSDIILGNEDIVNGILTINTYGKQDINSEIIDRIRQFFTIENALHPINVYNKRNIQLDIADRIYANIDIINGIHPITLYSKRDIENMIYDMISSSVELENDIASLSLYSKEQIVNELVDAISGVNNVILGIDPIDMYAFHHVPNSIVDVGLNESKIVSNAIGYNMANTDYTDSDLSIKLDGVEYKNKIIEASITAFDMETILPTGSIKLYSEDVIDATEFEISIAGNTYTFLIDEVSFDYNNKEVDLWGRHVHAEMTKPYSAEIERHYVEQSPDDIYNDVLGGIVSFDNKMLNNIITVKETKGTRLEILKDIASSIGGKVRSMFDGTIKIYSPEYYDNVVSLDKIFTFSKSKEVPEYDGCTVDFGDKREMVVLEIPSDEEIIVNEEVELRVYTLSNDFEFNTSVSAYSSHGRHTEVTTESISFENGNYMRTLKYPVVSIDVPANAKFDPVSNTLFFDVLEECMPPIDIEYTTSYVRYILINDHEDTEVACSVTTNSTYTITYGNASSIKEEKNDGILDIGTAKQLAESRLFDYHNDWTASATIPFEPTLMYNNISTCKIKGDVYFIKTMNINIKNNPMMIDCSLSLRKKGEI